MVSPVTFPYTRPSENSITKNKALKPLRPPPLNLRTEKKYQLPRIKAVRGSVSGADEGTEVPLMIELAAHRPSAPDALGGNSYEWIDMDVSKSRPWEGDGERPVSPPRSLRTIIDLDSPLASDDESDISPISDERPADHSSKVLARFFPELQSNFAVMAPEGLDTTSKPTSKPKTGRSRVENEIQARVKSLYHNSGDNLGQVLGSNTPSDENYLNRPESSDYSRQTSMASFGDGPFQRKNKYRMTTDSSNYSPVQAGVFDETPRSSKRMSGVRPAPTRLNTMSSKTSNSNLRDMRNKPLPLAPLIEPISTDSHHDHQQSSAPHHHSSAQCTDCTPQHHNVPHSAYASRNRQPHRCQTCGHCDNRHRRGSLNPPEYHQNSRNHQRHVSTWQQAADEMEIELSLDGMKRRLVLEGPLQISRNNGELVAARPAPMPPSLKPYSESTKKATRTGSVNSRRDISGSSKKGHKYSRSKDSTDSNKAKPSKAKDESKSRWGGNSRSNDGTKGDLLKLKKSFSISRATFTRKQNQTRSDQHRLSTLSSRSETSVDPQADHASPTDKTRLSLHLSQSDPNLEKVLDEDDPLSHKRDDLLLQLPRLQTDNFGFKTLLDQFAPDAQTALDNPANSKTSSLQTESLGFTSVYEQLIPTQRPLLTDQVQSPWLDDTRDAKEVIPSFTIRRPLVVRDEKMVVTTNRMRQSAFISTAKASSVYFPPEEVYELAAGPTSPESLMPKRSATAAQFQVNFPLAEIGDSILEMIMERITSLDDLFNFVLVNKRFYRVFKNRELPIIKSALYQMSRPAWELREMSPPWTTEWQHVLDPDSQVPEYTPSLYLDRYAQDIYTLAQLKSMILMRCAPFMRRDTVRGLAGLDEQRAEEVDNAFWRIWTFCRIFGSGKGRENDLEGQVDWLRGGVKARKAQGSSSSMTEPFGINNVLFEPPEGFAHGNYNGLTPTELYDMTEIWTCLGVLVQPLHAKCIEARNVGIFKGIDVPENDPVREETVLEEWTSYVLTLGLSAVLMVSSLNPSETTAITFERANAVGLTKWEMTEGQNTRSSFMKEAVSRVYDDRGRYSFSLPSGSADSPCELPSNEVTTREEDSERRQVFSQEIRVQRREGRNQSHGGDSFAMERPMSTYSTILHSLGGSIGRIVNGAPSVPPVPPLTFDRSSTSTGSRSPPPPGTPNYAPGTPQHAPGTPTHTPNYMLGTPGQVPTSEPKTPLLRSPPHSGSFMPAPLQLQPQVQDPVDRAISRMVNELGFFEDDVKWALKITDTGEGINVQAAEQLLHQQKKKSDRNPFVTRGRNNNGKNPLLMSVMKQQGTQESGWRWA
ncbi:hypothetical protein N7451_009947 [Penicillium sp. IBT 35674x]|nr:hypothetical protein N7451_009947 [Penicillium sp. IBT 35674x]